MRAFFQCDKVFVGRKLLSIITKEPKIYPRHTAETPETDDFLVWHKLGDFLGLAEKPTQT